MSYSQILFLSISFAFLTACGGDNGSDFKTTTEPGPEAVTETPGNAPSGNFEITSTPNTSAVEGQRWTYDLKTQFAANDDLGYQIVQGPAGMSVSEEGQLQWLPTNGVIRADVVVKVLAVSETGIRSAQQRFTLFVTSVNTAPIITSSPSTSVMVGGRYSYQLVVADEDDRNNGIELTYRLTNSPSGMTVSSRGLIEWNTSAPTSIDVTVEVSDGGEDAVQPATQSWTIQVVGTNTAPIITSSPVTSATEDISYSYQLVVDDAEDRNNGSDISFALSQAPAGMTISSTGLIEWTPLENGTETYVENVVVTVADGGENGVMPISQDYQIIVSPVNDAPTINALPTGIAIVDTLYSYQLDVTDVDDANNGTDLTFSLVSGPENMTVTATGLVEWTPIVGDVSVSAEIQVADGGENGTAADSVSWTIDVRSVNRPPVIELGESRDVSIDEDSLTTTRLSAIDEDGDTLTWTVTSAASNGNASVTSEGIFTYQPTLDFNGSDSFEVTVSDGLLLDSIVVNVTVNAVNDAPVITSEATLVATEDEVYSYAATATDVENDVLIWSLSEAPQGMTIDSATGIVSWTPENGVTSADVILDVTDSGETASQSFAIVVTAVNDAPEINEGATASLDVVEDTPTAITLNATDADGDTISWSIVGAANNGTALVSGTGNSKTIEYTPVANFNGSDSFTVQISDNTATDEILVTVNVNAVNDAPEITSTPITTATEAVEYRYTVTASDIDGDDLTFSLTANPQGMSIDATTGVITWTPANGVTSANVTVEVSDSIEPVSQSFTISVGGVNDAPVITEETASITTAEDTQGSVTLNATDIDGDTINWSVSSVASNGVAAVSGSGESQVISYTPNADFNGEDTFTVEITDGPATDSIDVFVTVSAVNDSPVFANAASTSAVEGSLYQYTPVVTDVDDANNGTNLTFTLVVGPEGMSVSPTGVVSWTPPNGVPEAGVTLQVADGGEDASLPDSQSWTISVGGINDAPSITSNAPTSATEDVQYQYQVQVTDPDDANNGTDLTFTLTSAPEGMTVSAMGLIQWTPENNVFSADVTVQVADGGESGVLPAMQSWTIAVTAVNDAPEITSTAITTATEDEAYSYTVAATDVDIDTVLTFRLTTAPQGMIIDSATGQITWTPGNDVASENVVVEVSDGEATDTQAFTITVTAVNDAPTITSQAVTTATEDEAYSYVVTAEDIDGDDLMFSLTTKPSGMTIDANTGAISWTPANNVTSETVTVQVSDGTLTASQTFTITVAAVNDAPEITSTPLTGALEDTLYSYDVNATDIDGDTLSYRLTVSPVGMVIDDSTGVITWTPANGVESEPVTVEVSDGQLAVTQSFTITIGATNDAPVITEEAPTLTTAEDTQGSVTLNATDIDGDTLTWFIAVPATKGTAAVSGTGDSQTVTYTPNPDINGSDSFIVQVSDATATDTVAVNVTITAENDAPVVTSTAITTATEDTAYAYTVMATDVDGDTLSYGLTQAPEGMAIDSATGVITWTPANGVTTANVTVNASDASLSATQSFTIAVSATNDAPVVDSTAVTVATEDEIYTYTVTATDIDGDTLSYGLITAPEGMSINSVTGQITWTPANGVTSENVTVEVSDSQATDRQSFTITVTPVNDAPEITQTSATIDTDEDNTGSVTLNATDVDGDTISWSIVANGTKGSAVVSGTGASQTVNYTPNANFNGVDSFTVQVSDNVATDTLVVSVTVNAVNDAPEIISTAITSATEDEDYGYNVAASDIDGDSLVFSLTVAPEGMNIDSTSGAISWTPENGVTTAPVTVQVSDNNLTATQSFTITVTPVNDAPVITSTAITGATEAVEYSYTVVANDIDGDTLEFALTASPEGMAINSTTGLITWTPANGVASANVTVEVSDGQAMDTQSFTITVGAVNDAPVITEGATTTLATDEDIAANLTLNATDVDGDEITWSIVSPATKGAATVSGAGNSKVVNYTPNANFNGPDSFTVQVADAGGLTDTIVVNVTVNAVADAPVITEGNTSTQSTNEDTSKTFALNATDVDSSTLTWSIVTPASHGTATVSGTGVSQMVNYAPAANFNGNDSFVVQVSDGVLTDSITVNMTVVAVNDLPVITSAPVTTATEGQVYTYLPAANDVDGDTLTWNLGTAPATMTVNSATGLLTWTPANGDTSAPVTLIVSDTTGSVTQSFTINLTTVNDAPVITQGDNVAVTMSEDSTPQAFSLVLNATDADNAATELTWSIATAAINGSATVSGTGTTKMVNYTPTANYSGSDSFIVKVFDGTNADSITVNVTIEAANDAPVITEPSAAIVTDEDVTDALVLNATDVDSDAASLTWTILTQAGKGTASVSAINTGASMLVTYSPTVNTNGADSFVVQVSDGQLTDTITVDVTVNPVDDVPTIAQGGSIGLTTDKNTAGSVLLNGIDVDTDGANLVWSVSTAASNGVASLSGTGTNVSAGYIPADNYVGNDSFIVELSDGTSTDSITVNVTVVATNTAPVINSTAVTNATAYQVYAYDVQASDVDNDGLTYSLTTAPSGMQIDSDTGAIRWIPTASDSPAVEVSVFDGTDSQTQSFNIAVQPEAKVSGRAVKGVLANADVEAAIYVGIDGNGDHIWNVIGTTTTDAKGYFGFDLNPQAKPVRIRTTTNASTTMMCDAPEGCDLIPYAGFGEVGTPAEGLIMDTIVSGADFAGPISVTPITNMAAQWLQALPKAMDDNVVLLAQRRITDLFNFDYPNETTTFIKQRAIDITDGFELNQAITSDINRVRHAVLAASVQKTAYIRDIPIDAISNGLGQMFGLLGGQVILKTGEIDLSSLNLANTTAIDYTGLDSFVESAKDVSLFLDFTFDLNDQLDELSASFDTVITDWNPELFDPTICLDTDPSIDRTTCRNVSTLGGATGFNAADFDRVLTPLDVYDSYYRAAAEAEASINLTNRNLNWLYVTPDDQANTANLVNAFTSILGYGIQTSLCVPQINNFTSCSVTIDPEYTGVNASISGCSGRGTDSCDLDITGSANGQIYNLAVDNVPDIRELLGGRRRGILGQNYDFTAGPIDICYTGSISNTTSILELNNFCLTLDVSNSPADVLNTFAGMTVLDYADETQLNNAIAALSAKIYLELGISNNLTIRKADNSINPYVMNNINMSLTFDREVVNGNKSGPIFVAKVANLSRTNPAGETLNPLAGQDIFNLEINDTSRLRSAKTENNVGLPPIESTSDITIQGLAPVIDILEQYVLSLLDTSVAAPTLTPEQWQDIQDQVQAQLAYSGTNTINVKDNPERKYIITLAPEGFIEISQANSTANAMRVYLSGAAGYVYGNDTLVSTAHLGNKEDGLLLSLVDGTQRRYVNANADPAAEIQGFLDFIEILFPQTPPQ